jgi:serine/threonine-protein kinase HipA
LARLVGDLCMVDDLREYMRRVLFVVLSGNVDAHLKNWSLLYPDRRRPRLSPAYDMVFVMLYPNIERRFALKLAGEKVPAAITWKHIERVERLLRERGLDAPIVDDARAFVRRALGEWSVVREDVGRELREALDAHLGTIQLARG